MKRSQQSVRGVEQSISSSDGGSINQTMPTKGGRNATTEQSHRGAGQVAPRPRGGAHILGNDLKSAPVQAGMARVKNVSSTASSGIANPVRKPVSGIRNQRIGQQNPQTGATATVKPRRKGIGAAFYGEY